MDTNNITTEFVKQSKEYAGFMLEQIKGKIDG
jgi:hypothetical protein